MEDPILEVIAEDVHKGWMAEKQKQGFADHAIKFPLYMGGPDTARCSRCSRPPEKHHADMLPYEDLADNVKEYDRATARAVFQGLGKRGYKIVPHWE
jgi:hypothetical protein